VLKAPVRKDGFAASSNQMIFGLAALSAPVFGADGQLEVALTVVLPAKMLTAAEPGG
jgi:DNA-binding IclR family transcriptional regulator